MFEPFQSDVPGFRARLSETMAWVGEHAAELSRRCHVSRVPSFWKSPLKRRANRLWAIPKLHKIVPLAQQLPSPNLHPASFACPQSPAERAQIVEAVAEKRADPLRLEHRDPIAPVDDWAGGRLLKYAPDQNLCDGAAQYSSKAFFDVDNIPPWDTWICSLETDLIRWVPPRLLDLANTAIDAESRTFIQWARET